VRIGELAHSVGVSPDTIRFYEREGLLPRPPRAENGYRDYRSEDAEHLRLVADLRRLDIPLDTAAKLATWCHSGHCDRTSEELPREIAERRRDIARRIEGLRELDARLERLERHLVGSATGRAASRGLPVLDAGACCAAAEAVGSEATCSCCAD
jgi:DNA-binding transcriptional MerR regulator